MTAFDVRNTTSPVAGVLQIASYISGVRRRGLAACCHD
jgi:hypothetical protein